MFNWHGVFTALGILVSLYVARKMADRLGLNADDIWDLAPYVVGAALIGGRTAYVLSHLSEFASNPWAVVRIDQGGLASHGALLFALAAVYAYARRHGLPAERLLDALALAVPINYLTMRIGNFLVGELYGDPTSLPWGMVFPGAASPRHPAQLYDALGQAVALAILVRLATRLRRPGDLAWWTLIATSVVRLFSDSFRTELRSFGPLTLGQVGALMTIAVATALLLRRRQDESATWLESSTSPPLDTSLGGRERNG